MQPRGFVSADAMPASAAASPTIVPAATVAQRQQSLRSTLCVEAWQEARCVVLQANLRLIFSSCNSMPSISSVVSSSRLASGSICHSTGAGTAASPATAAGCAFVLRLWRQTSLLQLGACPGGRNVGHHHHTRNCMRRQPQDSTTLRRLAGQGVLGDGHAVGPAMRYSRLILLTISTVRGWRL